MEKANKESKAIQLAVANAIVQGLWVKCLISKKERDKIIEKNTNYFLSKN